MNTDNNITLEKEDLLWLRETKEKLMKKLSVVTERSKNKIPATTVNGVHDDRSDTSVSWTIDNGIAWWTNGFFGGICWQLYHQTGETRYADIARNSEKKLDQCFEDYYGLHHDVGFMWLPTAVADYRLTGNEESRKRGLHAANILAGRFNPAGQFIRAWNDFPGWGEHNTGWAIIDCLLNIPLLYWATDETGDPRFKQIAMMHADTVRKNFIREDGSSNHIVEFDPETGVLVRTHGGQGVENGSSWTRGQSWAVYGFIISYLHTGKKEYLETSKRVADYFIEHIPEDGLIPVDFCQPKEPWWMDDTAAAITASGLIDLAKNVDEKESAKYWNAAMKMLKAMTEKHCDWSENTDGILTHCSSAYHAKEHHISLVYADYYLLEAVLKLSGNDFFLW